MAKATAKPQNRRGSPEAIEKRRAARLFNDVLGGRGASAQKLDGRTEKRRQRLLKELADGMARGRRGPKTPRRPPARAGAHGSRRDDRLDPQGREGAEDGAVAGRDPHRRPAPPRGVQ